MGKKVYINGTSHMTKMAAMFIYGKNLQKSNRPRYQVSVYRTIGPLAGHYSLCLDYKVIVLARILIRFSSNIQMIMIDKSEQLESEQCRL